MSKSFFILLLMIVFSACTVEPEAIQYGVDQCAYCKMSISDPKFGSELITSKGRILKFDAAECMAWYIEDEQPANCRLLAVPYDAPNSLVPIDSLSFLISIKYKSPMGADLAGFIQPKTLPQELQDSLISWSDVSAQLSTPN